MGYQISHSINLFTLFTINLDRKYYITEHTRCKVPCEYRLEIDVDYNNYSIPYNYIAIYGIKFPK